MRSLTTCLFILLIATIAGAQPEDVLLTATHDKLNETVRQALGADAETLKKWSKKGPQDEAAKKEFCPHYEKRYLAGFYSTLAESKRETGDKARQATARATWMVYLLASMRPATKEDLKQLLLKAKDGAPESLSKEDEERGFATGARIERILAQLDQQAPGRLRISQEVAECFLVSKAQPRYPQQAKMQLLQGDAIMKIVVARDGTLMQVTPVGGPQIFLDASLPAVQQWRYRPYHLVGQPVEFETEVTVKFTLSTE